MTYGESNSEVIGMEKQDVPMQEVASKGQKQMDVHGVENIAQTKVVQGSAALLEAIAKEPPKPRSKRSLQLYAICSLVFFASTLNGYDGSLMGSILVMPP